MFVPKIIPVIKTKFMGVTKYRNKLFSIHQIIFLRATDLSFAEDCGAIDVSVLY